MSSQDELKDHVKNEVRDALAYFIERQRLVAQAMTEMGLDLNEVAEYGAAAWVSNLNFTNGEVQSTVDAYTEFAEADNDKLQKWHQLAKQASERILPQEGVWHDNEQNEWRYFLHGRGCRLTNSRTGEPIDWDCPDVNSYDIYKFMQHLIWQLSSLERAGKLISTYIWTSHSLKPLLREIKSKNSKP